jgi:hypothetical protein
MPVSDQNRINPNCVRHCRTTQCDTITVSNDNRL